MTTRARSAERTEFLSDVLTTAVEGGINYWAQVSGYRWNCPPAERGVTVHDVVGDDIPPEGRRVTLDDIARAVNAIAKAPLSDPEPVALGLHRQYRRQVVEASRENDAGDIDAGLADAIVQVAVFGEVIYG